MKLLYLILVLFSSTLAAQHSISGSVKDVDGSPLTGANIYLKGTIDGSISNNNGDFRFTTSSSGNHLLVCSYIGYEVQVKSISIVDGEAIVMRFTLRPTSIEGQEVTVRASTFNSGTGSSVTLTPLEVLTIPGAAADIFRAIQSFPGVQQVTMERDYLFVVEMLLKLQSS